ncbi:unnamed protein product [Phaedon cochleariae]|uniref:Fuseless n=1 Tax=Phaedon cochleariae TaxID=80249 RepID=A0A9P0DFK5_PHACE|nr:unnamed protein product [Phaedon cochleariae]
MIGTSTDIATDKVQSSERTNLTILAILDALFAALVVCPCVVCYWRAVWGLMDLYLEPLGSLNSGLVSIVIGMGGHIVFNVFQTVFEKNVHPDHNRTVYYLLSRLYTVCFAFVCVNGWRGPWECLNVHSMNDMVVLLATTGVGIAAMVSMKVLRNVTAPPFVVAVDDVKGYFEVTTMFKIKMREKLTLYLLDCLFSVVIVGTLIVFVWRGLWLIVDILLYPENEELSSWISMGLGYALMAFLLLSQPTMRYLCERLSGTTRVLFADAVTLLALFGTVNIWRGIWNLLPIYFFSDDTEMCCWITHWVTVIVLILCGASNSLLVKGVDIDAEEEGGECVNFQIYFFRSIYHKKKQKWKPSEMNLQVNHKDEITADSNHTVTIATIS